MTYEYSKVYVLDEYLKIIRRKKRGKGAAQAAGFRGGRPSVDGRPVIEITEYPFYSFYGSEADSTGARSSERGETSQPPFDRSSVGSERFPVPRISGTSGVHQETIMRAQRVRA